MLTNLDGFHAWTGVLRLCRDSPGEGDPSLKSLKWIPRSVIPSALLGLWKWICDRLMSPGISLGSVLFVLLQRCAARLLSHNLTLHHSISICFQRVSQLPQDFASLEQHTEP